MKFKNFFGFYKKNKKDNDLNKLKHDNYQNQINEFHKELNKSVNDFNIDLDNCTHKNTGSEKFGIITKKQ